LQLTRYTDYALRVLLYLGAQPERVCSIAEISQAYGLSQNHLMKIAHELGKAGYVSSVRGRMGGLRLARRPDQINVGAVVRNTETDLELAPCGSCVIAPACRLSSVLDEALAAFMAVLDGYTLADLLKSRSKLVRLFDVPLAKTAPARG